MSTKKILLAYASRFGSTQEVAETIAATLRGTGLEVEVQPMREVGGLANPDAIVLGAAIYNARWHADAHQFLSQHGDGLRRLPVAIFTLGPLSTSAPAMRNSRQQLDNELSKYPWLKPIAVEIFAGKYDPSQPGLGFFDRFVAARDLRDWDAIRAWASALSVQLRREDAFQPA